MEEIPLKKRKKTREEKERKKNFESMQYGWRRRNGQSTVAATPFFSGSNGMVVSGWSSLAENIFLLSDQQAFFCRSTVQKKRLPDKATCKVR